MDLGPTKTPSKLGGFSSKKLAFLAVACLVLVVGIGLRLGHYFGEPDGKETAPVAVDASPPEGATAPESATGPKVPVLPEVPALPEAATAPAVETTAEPVPETPPAAQEATTAPSEPVEQAGDAAEQPAPDGAAAEQAETPQPGDGMILVARRPVELLADPSPSATVMFGFPAGRPFRVIGHEGGFAHIKDLRSGATGWIDEAALAPPPPRAPAVAAPSQAKPAAGGQKSSTASSNPKPKATKDETSVADESAPAIEPRKRPGLFGGGGLFGGLFSNDN